MGGGQSSESKQTIDVNGQMSINVTTNGGTSMDVHIIAFAVVLIALLKLVEVTSSCIDPTPRGFLTSH